MKASAYFGYICPKCGSKFDICGVVGSSNEMKCRNCGTVMIPDTNGKTSTANAHCPNCNASFGIINSDKCPICKRPFQ